MKDQSYQDARSQIVGSAIRHLSSDPGSADQTLLQMDQLFRGVLGDPECPENIKSEVFALSMAIGVMLARSILDLSMCRSYRLKYYSAIDYYDKTLKPVNYLIENLSSGMNNDQLVDWHERFIVLCGSGKVSVPDCIIGDFIGLVSNFPLGEVLSQAKRFQ